ncbi:MAG: hypothetical protein B7Y45_12455 [Sphingomonas sp. 28-66-16]|nr:MAG: hypothetical protein B7Y45_12455 [Sphingomonas sp. 28-66-16]
MPTDPLVDAYIARQADFARPILIELRHRMHAVDPRVGETIKWSMPFFTIDGALLANMAAFKQHASFGLWRRDASPTGQEGEAMGQFGKLTGIADLPEPAAFATLVTAAIALIDAGPSARKRTLKPAVSATSEPVIPPELAAALAGDAAAKATFDGFPPSGRRDYIEWIAQAKRQETRDKRTAEAILWLREGKKRHWKYESC